MRDRCSVFIVGSDRDILEMMRQIVEDGVGCEAKTEAIGPSSFEHARAYNPKVVVLDFAPFPYARSHSQGLRLLQQLQTDEATSSTPVVTCSTTEPSLVEALHRHNVRCALLKPFDLEALTQAIRDSL